MHRLSTPQMSTLQQPISAPWYVFFRRGLITDLSNPQTVLFFISIFSVTLHAETPTWARLMAWAGIVLASIIWRVFLSQAFSLPAVRHAYGRMQRVASWVIGAIIGVFALRLIYEGVTQRWADNLLSTSSTWFAESQPSAMIAPVMRGPYFR